MEPGLEENRLEVENQDAAVVQERSDRGLDWGRGTDGRKKWPSTLRTI